MALAGQQRRRGAAARARPLPGGLFPLGDITNGALERSEHITRYRDLGATSWSTVRVGDQNKPSAARQHIELHRYASGLKGRPAFAWRAMDAFYEEDERIAGHAAGSYHRINIRQTSRHLVVRSCDHVVVDSRRPLGAVCVRVRSPLVRTARRHRRIGAHPGVGADNFPLYPKLYSWLRQPGPAADRVGKLSEGQDC
jgi:uncharacterized protein (DUF427 family)